MFSYKLISSIKHAPILIGACCCFHLANCSEEKPSTEKWETASRDTSESITDAALSTSSVKDQGQAKTDNAGKNSEVRFLAYNLKNYLSMRRYLDGKPVFKEKPIKEVDAIVQIIASVKPDVLGVCEIGKQSDLEDLQKRLAIAGLELPHTHRVHGTDKTRAQGLLSRYPITMTALPKKTNYTIEGRSFGISRGILDASVELPNRTVRLLGVHFKSKRPIQEADQALMRRNESLLLRQHIVDIMAEDPETQLLVYGDFNDTKNSKSVSSIRGRSNSNTHMKIIELSDTRGENWTHHWKHEDIYSRIDFVMVNSRLESHINKKESKLLDPHNWETASDHRPLLILID
jgi:endonuclease/exonuclease/phosphatase family metal-dependent hydrolase